MISRKINHYPKNCITIRGYQTAVAFSDAQLLHELGIRLGQVRLQQPIQVT